jgi:hypothetical protein
MSSACLHDDEGGGLGLAVIEQKLQIKRGQSVAVINAPLGSRLKLLAAGRPHPDDADVVIGFAGRPVELALLGPAYAAARAGRLVWLNYPKPGRPGTDLRREWLLRALQQYGVKAVEDVSINHIWSALRLRPAKHGQQPVTSAATGDTE